MKPLVRILVLTTALTPVLCGLTVKVKHLDRRKGKVLLLLPMHSTMIEAQVLSRGESSSNGIACCDKAVEMLRAGEDTLDAAIAGVNIVELDPEDTSVGYGGLPNEEGVVELDACVMHGPTARAGSVAALRGIRTPSKVAQLVLERTDHVMMVGSGALRFAKAYGFTEEDLLTERARIAWAREVAANPPPGTITCLTLNRRGEMSGVTTTSGLAWKIPGRIGDSPIIGAGLYVAQQVGAAGSTSALATGKTGLTCPVTSTVTRRNLIYPLYQPISRPAFSFFR